jgi:hypothetical protein
MLNEAVVARLGDKLVMTSIGCHLFPEVDNLKETFIFTSRSILGAEPRDFPPDWTGVGVFVASELQVSLWW